jgi:superfamily II DNA or RNA helicase/HKD family nuclease
MSLPRGLYDLVLTAAVERSLAGIEPDVFDVGELNQEDAADRFVDALSGQLRTLLSDIPRREKHPVVAQMDIINGLLSWLRESHSPNTSLLDDLSAPPRVLRGIRGPAEPRPISPETGLASPWLFTAGRGSPALLTELRREATSCDQIDILVSFITVSGVRKLIDILRIATAADASGAGRTSVRVLTTTYTGATEIGALDELARLNGCEVKVSLDGRRTRLHAKAWIFQRRTGFGSAYVGSANLSGAALMGGLEWTVKFTERGQGPLYDRAKAHFDTLWLDDEFTSYAPDDPTSRAAVVAALARETYGESTIPLHFFDIQPKTYQREMLDQLARERANGRTRNLVVAATGTGKTVVAALDYRDTCARLGHRPRLLFVAHRAQILRQALRIYREVLRDHSFGELLTGGFVPSQHEYLFASIDTLTTRNLVERLGASYWHTVVIDECHRLAADRFDRLATTIQPAQLLGLTATPERTDGRSIERYFSPRPDGSPAVELRLWDALDMQLLAPFEYYGCDDDTDFSEVPWDRPGEVTAIDRLVTGNHARARTVIDEWTRLSGNPGRGKAVVFCVSVAHAEYMTEQLNRAGLSAICVTGETPKTDQMRAPKRLANGEVCALVTVDLYNEGVDLPEVDTLLLLRPTQSSLLFQQQIGRGLRLSPGKESCLVLDFVGQHRADFRFDRLLSGITGLTRTQLIDAVENGFSGLPPGCHIQLQHQTRRQVLRSLRTAVQQNWRRLATEVQSYATVRGTRDVPLRDFLYDQRIQLGEVYRASAPSGWTTLKRTAGLLSGEALEGEAELSRRFGDLLHIDDPAQIRLIRHVSESPADFTPKTTNDRLRAQMFAYQVNSSRKPLAFEDMLQQLVDRPNCATELGELADVLSARSRVDERMIPGMEDIPLQLHGAYRIREILTAVGYLTPTRWTPFQAGVLALPDRKTELLFVTLDKSEGFHDRIAYHDYALSPERFHWQTQNSAAPDTKAGRRYLESLNNGWQFQLFVRVTKADPYRACGPMFITRPDDVTGARPMSITWTLKIPLPAQFFADFSVLRGQA